MLQGKRIFIIIHIRADRAVAVLDEIPVILPQSYLFSEIKLTHLTISKDLHHIADGIIVQVKLPCLFIK